MYHDGQWVGLAELAHNYTCLKDNPQYWPSADQIGDLRQPVVIDPSTAVQLESLIVAARWTVCQAFHRLVGQACQKCKNHDGCLKLALF